MSKHHQQIKSFDKYLTLDLLFTTIVVIIILLLTAFPFSNGMMMMPRAYASTSTEEPIEFTLRTSQHVYVPGETLEVRGTAEPDQVLVIRLYDPVGLAIRIENVEVDPDGSYRANVFTWPEPSRNLVFGTYTVEVLSPIEGTEPLRAEVAFAGGFDQGIDPSRSHTLGVKLDSPSQITVNSPFRIFVQVTFDGALVDAVDDNAVEEILGTSHIHSNNSTIILSDRFSELHPGIYYSDIVLENEGTYVVHASAFYRGFLSHDTKLLEATGSSIGTIQESVNELGSDVDRLNLEIETTNNELERLREGIDDTQHALNETKTTITNSVDEARTSIREQIELAQQASSQVNAFILPVLALISVIIALQISLFARIRASYR